MVKSNSAQQSPAIAKAKPHFAAAGTAAVILLTLAFIVACEIEFLGPKSERGAIENSDFSTAYTDALARGHSYLAAKPDPALLSAKDPFGPSTRHLLLWDSSFFRGHYYMYFGIVPFVVFMVPYEWITGFAPHPSSAILFFGTVGLIGYGVIIYCYCREFAKEASLTLVFAATMAVFVGSGTIELISRPAIYEIENASAFAFLSLALAFVFLTHVGKGGLGFIACSSTCAALTMGCRPDFFPAVTILAAWQLHRMSALPMVRRRWLMALIAVIVPAILVGAALGSWNYLRFGDVFDFGLKHTISEDPGTTRSLSSPSFIRYNLYRYTLGGARISHYFPFIQGQKEGPFPTVSYQEDSNQVYGFILCMPILLFSLLPTFRCIFQRRYDVRSFVLVTLLAFAGNFIFLCSIALICYRYPSDFLGPLALLASIGILSLPSIERVWLRIFSTLLAWLLLFWSILIPVLTLYCTAEYVSLYDVRRARAFDAVAKPFNAIEYWLESEKGESPGCIALKLDFPKDRSGYTEPLLVTGERGAQDFVYVRYIKKGVVQFGYEASGEGGILSRYVEEGTQQMHRIDVQLGSFLPPNDHPLFLGISPKEIEFYRRVISVKMDGVPVLDGLVHFHPVRANIFVGHSPDDDAFGTSFSGTVKTIDPEPFMRAQDSEWWQKQLFGPMVIRMKLFAIPAGTFQPVVSVGEVNEGGQLLLEMVKAPLVRFFWIDTNGTKVTGAPFLWDAEKEKTVSITAGALFPPIDSNLWRNNTTLEKRSILKQHVEVDVSGVRVFAAAISSLDVAPSSISVGQDTLFLRGGVYPDLVGKIDSVARLKWW